MEECVRVGQATDENIIRRMRFTWWIIKATQVHLEYAIYTAFLRQQWLRERASLLGLYVHFLSFEFLYASAAGLGGGIGGDKYICTQQ